ncbi:MAG: hypothetical protein QOI25_4697 [Mycobacterium sp.]|jgi:hypothetical protein|nr:hypothetical protein [Mycobacterium sp.]
MAAVSTVNQLRTAIKLEPRPKPEPRPEPRRSISKTGDEQSSTWRITLPHDEAAGPLLSNDDRRYLTCDATCEVWFQRDGRVIGSGRATRTVGRRLRRVLEHRDRCCVIPGCGATRGLHAHHIQHWEDGGITELDNLVLVCPHHHRAHHRGVITITGPAQHLVVTDYQGRTLKAGSLARPPTTPHQRSNRARGLPVNVPTANSELGHVGGELPGFTEQFGVPTLQQGGVVDVVRVEAHFVVLPKSPAQRTFQER